MEKFKIEKLWYREISRRVCLVNFIPLFCFNGIFSNEIVSLKFDRGKFKVRGHVFSQSGTTLETTSLKNIKCFLLLESRDTWTAAKTSYVLHFSCVFKSVFVHLSQKEITAHGRKFFIANSHVLKKSLKNYLEKKNMNHGIIKFSYQAFY